MLFLLPSLLLSLLLSVSHVQAATLTQEDKIEVQNRWEAYFKGQDENEACANYIAVLLDITDADAEIAGRLAGLSLEQDAFKKFVENKDLDATLSFIELMTFVLQRTVWEECALRFPPQLADIPQDMEKSGLTEQEYLTNLRRAFLAFTIIVSCMDQVINLEQLA